MNKEIKVALSLLVCLLALIGYFEYKKSSPEVVENEISTEIELEVENIEPVAEEIPLPQKIVKKEEPVDVVVAPEPPSVAEVIVKPMLVKKEHKPKVENFMEHKAIKRSNQEEKQHIPSEYTVKKGDTVSQIAQEMIGSIKYLPLLMEKNPELRADQLYVGITLAMPTMSDVRSFKAKKALSQKEIPPNAQSYIIEKGDNINKISLKKYGNRKMVKAILEMNPNLDPRKLSIGSLIILPKK